LNLSSVDINSTFSYNVDLPSNYKNLSGFNSVDVKFNWNNYASKTISIDKSKIFVINAPSKYDIKVKTSGISNIKIIGPKNVINNITAANIIAEVDLFEANLNESNYSMPVKIYSPQYNNVWAYGNYNVTISVSEK
jgi:cobalamin biosynthesis Co2+ chelatase CbiK